jgi:CheY-like chemotaxis protein
MTAPDASARRVLLVEDEALIVMLMEDMLIELGYEIGATAGQLEEAIEIANSQPFDLAFIDVNLRGVPVWPLAEVLRARGVPFAFVTGYGTAATAGAQADEPILQKPFQVRELQAVLSRLRSQRR